MHYEIHFYAEEGRWLLSLHDGQDDHDESMDTEDFETAADALSRAIDLLKDNAHEAGWVEVFADGLLPLDHLTRIRLTRR
jgi:hypothetical protein